jgi:hypothetical protein
MFNGWIDLLIYQLLNITDGVKVKYAFVGDQSLKQKSSLYGIICGKQSKFIN